MTDRDEEDYQAILSWLEGMIEEAEEAINEKIQYFRGWFTPEDLKLISLFLYITKDRLVSLHDSIKRK